MSPRNLPGISKQPNYGALYQPSEPNLVSPEKIYHTAGLLCIKKCLQHSKQMLLSTDTGHCLFDFLETNAAPSRVNLPPGTTAALLDDAADSARLLSPQPASISGARRRHLPPTETTLPQQRHLPPTETTLPQQRHLPPTETTPPQQRHLPPTETPPKQRHLPPTETPPQQRVQQFVDEMRTIGWILMSLRNMRLAWLLRSAPLPVQYVRLIRRADFEWFEPLMPTPRRLPVEIGTVGLQFRRLAGRPMERGFVRPQRRSVSRASASRRQPRSIQTVKPAHAYEDGCPALPTWNSIVTGLPGAEKVLSRPEHVPPPWQYVANQERRQRRIALDHNADASGAVRLLQQVKQSCADSRQRLFHMYDHRVQLMDAERQNRMRHKYQSVQTAACAERALVNTRREVKRRTLADLPAVIPARWYSLLQKRATDLGCDAAIMAEFEERIGPFITEEPSTLPSGAERLCMLVMSLPAYELLLPRWQRALLFVLVEVLQHHEGLLHAWILWRQYLDYILYPTTGGPDPAPQLPEGGL